ncbi:MAG TPA: stage V sporulation protein D [Clostridia bacterium]|nr:stage V sporulation protein D [Clostridia bacterium]
MNLNLMIRKRIAVLFFLIAGILFLLSLRLVWIQVIQGDWLQEKAMHNRLREVRVEAKRGIIYDRNGKELAISVSTDSVGAFPSQVRRSGREREIAAKLAELLEMDEEEVYAKITKNASFVWVKRKIGFELGPKIKAMDLPGIEVYEESQRYYPNDTLAAHVLGFAGIDNQGLEGLEKKFDEELRGEAGRIIIEFDAVGREIPQATHQYIPPTDGSSIVLTIDETIQYIVERELDNLMAGPSQPKSAAVIVMDPRNGDILALSSRPTFNPNQYNQYPQSSWRNVIVSNTYEPGSTFKILIAAMALEEKVVGLDDRFYDPGYIKVGKETIKCWRSGNPHGSQSFLEGIENSCNPVFVEVGLRVEEKQKNLMYRYLRAFGLGQPTGVELFGEAKGIMIPEEQLKTINLATISIGQGIAVTPLQLVTAVSAVVNGGYLMKPRLVKEILNSEGEVIQTFEPEVVRQVISGETSRQIALALERVVSNGTGRNAYIPGYRVGGKTGTAQIAGPGGYQQGKYVASFIGVAPVDDPRLVALVVVEEPQGIYYGGTVAAPVFKRIVEDALYYLGVPPQYNEEELAGQSKAGQEEVVVPDVTNIEPEQATAALEAAGLVPSFRGQGNVVVSQTPKGLAKAPKGTKVILHLGTVDGGSQEVMVPDLTGKRIPEAAALVEALGLTLKPRGAAGKAVEQEPIPGTLVPRGTSVVVTFSEEEVQRPALGP